MSYENSIQAVTPIRSKPMGFGWGFKYRWGQLVGVVFFAGIVSNAQADRDGEREALAQIVYELKALAPLIQTAKAQVDSDARIQFQYDWLLLDLHRVSSGIEEHLIAPRTEPRTFPPLKGDYRH